MKTIKEKDFDKEWIPIGKPTPLIILDDWKSCLPLTKKQKKGMKKTFRSMKKYCSEFSVSLPKSIKGKNKKKKQ